MNMLVANPCVTIRISTTELIYAYNFGHESCIQF